MNLSSVSGVHCQAAAHVGYLPAPLRETLSDVECTREAYMSSARLTQGERTSTQGTLRRQSTEQNTAK